MKVPASVEEAVTGFVGRIVAGIGIAFVIAGACVGAVFPFLGMVTGTIDSPHGLSDAGWGWSPWFGPLLGMAGFILATLGAALVERRAPSRGGRPGEER